MTLRRTCYFNTRQLAFNFNHHLPHGSVVTRDCEPRHLQVPATISSTVEPRTTNSGRRRITTGCWEGEMFEFLLLTNNKRNCTSLRGSWQINSTGKNKQTKTKRTITTTTTTETKKQNQGSLVNNKDISKS